MGLGSASATRKASQLFVWSVMLKNSVAAAGGVESALRLSLGTGNQDNSRTGDVTAEHYEIVLNEDGEPLELSRGAMGVTYKAFDSVTICACPVTAKKSLAKSISATRRRGSGSAGSACRRERVPSQRRLGLPPWEEGARLLLRDGVCGGGNSGQPHQALGTA